MSQAHLDSDSTPRIPSLVALLATAALLTAGLAFATLAQADEDIDIQSVIKLALDGNDAEVIRLDASDMEIGDSRQLYTESGKEVVVTRGEDGFEITIDGEDLDMPTIHQERKVVMVRTGDDAGDLDGEHEVIITTHGEGEHFFHHGDGEARSMVFIADDGSVTDFDIDTHTEGFAWSFGDGAKVLRLDSNSAAQHLEESGALDGLDADTRERILEVLRQREGGQKNVRVIVTGEDRPHQH